MPYISTEALVGGVILVALALGYQYIPLPSSAASGTTGGSSKKKNKNKKKSGKGTAGQDGPSDRVEQVKQNVTGGSKEANGSSDAFKTKAHEVVANGQTSTATAAPTKPKTLAQKLAPQPRKSKVDDMLAPEDLPGQHARVMRVTGQNPTAPVLAPPIVEPEQKVEKFSDDYASSSDDEEEEKQTASASGSGGSQKREDDGWGVVAGKKKKPISINFTSNPQTATSLPLPTATKVQRKNQKKAEANKAARAAEEEERLRRLAMHKRQQEKAKIDDLYGSSKKKGGNGGGGGQAVNSAKASLDHNGKLIWD